METLLKKLFQANSLTGDDLLYLLNNVDAGTEQLLFDLAHKTRIKNFGKKVYLRGLLEFSNYCRQNCLYCGLRRDNRRVSRYRLSREEIWRLCQRSYELGFRTFVLQSGEDPFYTDDLLADIIAGLKERFPAAAVTLSLGEKSRHSYQRYFAAGADRYLLRHETAARPLYERLHPGMSLQNRQKCLQELKEIGYQVGAGFIVGLPEQGNEELVADLLYLKNLQPHMVGIGPLIVHPDTPLRDWPNGSGKKTLLCLALTRLLLPEVLLPATTALNVLSPNGLERGLQAGANVVMLNIAPAAIRVKYELYKGRVQDNVEGPALLEKIKTRIIRAGFSIDMGRGDHPGWTSNREKESSTD
ncbi:MAG TPA: [FeFe] hydrogenase H-cluster radical SAM maturase HydE [Firmicutes bacterium]|nr:[FeFe] hydrogenase H-cluster radical SAM maturase HydE [Bacillota bacterium]